MTPKEDAVKLLKISDVILNGIIDYTNYDVTGLNFSELTSITEAQVKIAYELGKASK